MADQRRMRGRRQEDHVISIEEATRNFAGNWVLFEIVEEQDRYEKHRGFVRYSGESHDLVLDESIKLRDKNRAAKAKTHLTIFFAYPLASLEDEIERYFDELEDLELMARETSAGGE